MKCPQLSLTLIHSRISTLVAQWRGLHTTRQPNTPGGTANGA